MEPKITIAVPSFNQGQFLDKTLQSIFSQDVPVEVFVLDGGSTDNSVEVIKKWEPQITWWRSESDDGQAAAINEGIAKGTAPYVCWLNADDLFLPNGLKVLLQALESRSDCPAVYGKCWTIDPQGNKTVPYLTAPFWPWLFANFCFIAQPATLVRRSAWEAVNGLDVTLHMAMDYDLWWRLYLASPSLAYSTTQPHNHTTIQPLNNSTNPLGYVKEFVAGTRMHAATKTAMHRKAHYQEAMAVVKKHYGRIALKWYVAWPLMVTLRTWGKREAGSGRGGAD